MSFIKKLFKKEEAHYHCRSLINFKRFAMKNGIEKHIIFFGKEDPELVYKYKELLKKNPDISEDLSNLILKGFIQDWIMKHYEKCGRTFADIDAAAAYEEKLEQDKQAGGKAKKSVKQSPKKSVKRSKPKNPSKNN